MAIFFNSSGSSCEVFYFDITNSNLPYENESSSKPCNISIFKKEKIEDTDIEKWVLVEEKIIILNNFVVGDITSRFDERMRDQYNYHVFRSMFFAGGEKIEITIEDEFGIFYTDNMEDDKLNGEIIWADSPSTFYIPHSELYNYKLDVFDKNQNKIEIVDFNQGPPVIHVSSLETRNIWGMENVLVNKVTPASIFYMLVSSSLKNKEVSTRQVINANGCIITISQLVRPNFENIFLDKRNPSELYEKTYACEF